MAFEVAEVSRPRLSIGKESIRFKKAVTCIRKINHPFQKNALVGSIHDSIDVNEKEIVRRMCDGSGNC